MMFKVKHGLAPMHISKLFNAKNMQYNSRNIDFELSKFETVQHARHSIEYLGPLNWSFWKVNKPVLFLNCYL